MSNYEVNTHTHLHVIARARARFNAALGAAGAFGRHEEPALSVARCCRVPAASAVFAPLAPASLCGWCARSALLMVASSLAHLTQGMITVRALFSISWCRFLGFRFRSFLRRERERERSPPRNRFF